MHLSNLLGDRRSDCAVKDIRWEELDNWKGDFEPGAKKITKFIGESAGIGLLNVLVIRKREVDF